MLFASVHVADGSIAFLRTGCISVVSAVACTVPTVDFNAPDPHLDIKHRPYLLCLAPANAWAALVGS